MFNFVKIKFISWPHFFTHTYDFLHKYYLKYIFSNICIIFGFKKITPLLGYFQVFGYKNWAPLKNVYLDQQIFEKSFINKCTFVGPMKPYTGRYQFGLYLKPYAKNCFYLPAIGCKKNLKIFKKSILTEAKTENILELVQNWFLVRLSLGVELVCCLKLV